MKKIFFLVLSLFSVGLFAQEIKWMTMQEALDAQAKKPKKIFMDVYTNWCGPCKMLDRNTFHNKDVVKYINKNFYAVKFNAEGNEEFTYKGNTYNNPNYQPERKGRNSQHMFAGALKVRGYPSMVFFDENANMIFPITGYHKATQLEIFLKLIATDDYKAVTTQKDFDQYQNDFQTTFVD